MTKKLALFDIDNTVYNGYIIFSLAEYQLNKKTIKQECFNNIYDDGRLYKEGVLDYEAATKDMLDHWAKGLKGVSQGLVLSQTKYFLETKGNKFYPFLKPVIKLLQKTHEIYFVTGEPEFVGQTVSWLYRATGSITSKFDSRNSIFTGRVKTFLARREDKRKAISQLLKNHDTKNSFAFGDSEGDIEMLNSVEYAICINPNEGLQKVIKEKGWIVTEPHKVEEIVKNILTSPYPDS